MSADHHLRRSWRRTRNKATRRARRAEHVGPAWTLRFLIARRRGSAVARHIEAAHELRERLRYEAWIDPSLMALNRPRSSR